MSSVTNATGSVPTNNNLIMNLVKMVEVWIEDRKVSLSSRLDGSESDAERALIFYSISGKLSVINKDISPHGRIMSLATNCNLEHISELYMNSLIQSYMDQVFDPANWQVISFHNQAGTILDLSVTAAGPHILKPLGLLVTDLAGAARRQEHIHFSNVRVSVNFQSITVSDELYSIYTFTKLPNGQ